MIKKIILMLFLLCIGGKGMSIEQPDFSVIKKNDNFELRKYAPYVIAETKVSGDFDEAGNKAFRTLFGYINGNNKKKSKIEMTAPVEQTSSPQEGEKIPMTAPVSQVPESGTINGFRVRFVMPSGSNLDTLPEPIDPNVELIQIEERVMAVRVYSGTWSEKRYRKNEKILMDSVEEAGYQIEGEPVFARYNSPFSLWFFRRNEVQIEIQPLK